MPAVDIAMPFAEAHGRMAPIVKVKNTFIDIQDNCVEHEEGLDSMDLNKFAFNLKRRQVSEPCPSWERQMSGFARQHSPAFPPNPEEAIAEVGEEQEQPSPVQQRPDYDLLSAFQAAGEGNVESPAARTSLFINGAPGQDMPMMEGVAGPPDAAACAELMAGAGAISQASLPPDWQNAHTVMMRNLPNKYTQQMLLNEVNQAGFYGTFDFLYLPIDPETGANRGYAFMNFIHPCLAWMFRTMYEGRKMSSFNSSKVVGVTPAALQGFEANYGHYSTARVNRGDPATRPLFLRSPSPSATPTEQAGVSVRRGRRRRGGGASAIDLAARQQQRQRLGLERQREEERQVALPNALFDSSGYEVMASPDMMGTPVAASTPSEERSPRQEAGRPRPANFCPHCGAKVQPHFLFCSSCGGSTALDSPPPSSPVDAVQALDPYSQKLGPDATAAGGMYYVMMPQCYPEPMMGASPWLAA
jgi:hypothetical protein